METKYGIISDIHRAKPHQVFDAIYALKNEGIDKLVLNGDLVGDQNQDITQTDFFEKGAAHIKPMILRDIANDIGMHESTVSRVTTNKYVHTPQGIFELKYFFNSGISKSDGDSLASESVKLKIKNLISDEDPKNPLSDQKIVDLLKKEGIKIARRTVAKYRDVLKILPSSKRKKYF